MMDTSAEDLRSPQRQLIECQMAHADLDALIDQAALARSPWTSCCCDGSKNGVWLCVTKWPGCSGCWTPRSLLEFVAAKGL